MRHLVGKVERQPRRRHKGNRREGISRGMTEASGLSMCEDIHSPDAQFAFGWNRFNLSLIGLWPDQTRDRSKANFVTRYSSPIWGIWVISFIVLPQAIAPIFYSFMLDELIQIFAGLAGIIGAVVKIMVLWFNGEAWCLSFLDDDWMRKLMTEERELMMKNAKLGRNISIGFTILMHCLVWSYVALKTLPLININLDGRNTTELVRLLFYPACFPFDLRKPLNFVFAMFGQLFATFSSTIAYTASDCFVAMLVIHLCGQIAILRESLENVIENEKSVDRETFRENLAIIVKRHKTLIKFATTIEDTVNSMLLVLTMIYTVQFGLQLFGLMTAVTERKPGQFPFLQVLFFISYINVTVVHLFLYCYVGDMLIEESEALGLASYCCKWYDLSGSDAKDLMIVMHRARSPLQISAGKFVAFSLEHFGDVLKTSMSYFSVLLTIKEQTLQ